MNTVDSLIIDLLEWLEKGPQPYDEVMSAWRTSCPRLPVWEEANDRGLLVQTLNDQSIRVVAVSAAGASFLQSNRVSVETPN
jgi:D-3-phosphoglycerate dehydrogenase